MFASLGKPSMMAVNLKQGSRGAVTRRAQPESAGVADPDPVSRQARMFVVSAYEAERVRAH
jgi:hypothetical protein